MKNNNKIVFNVYPDKHIMSDAVAEYLSKRISQTRDLLLCPAAGTTPVATYKKLVEKLRANRLEYGELKIIKLDEWLGLPANSRATCDYQIKQQLLQPLNIKKYFGFAPDTRDTKSEIIRCNRFLARNGPIDLCILGLGTNGHLGFIEPDQHFLHPFPHVARLAESSQHHRMLSGISDKPRQGLTLGMYNILTSREIVLLVSGAAKKPAVKQLKQARISTNFPASFLWLHPRVTCFCDEEAYT